MAATVALRHRSGEQALILFHDAREREKLRSNPWCVTCRCDPGKRRILFSGCCLFFPLATRRRPKPRTSPPPPDMRRCALPSPSSSTFSQITQQWPSVASSRPCGRCASRRLPSRPPLPSRPRCSAASPAVRERERESSEREGVVCSRRRARAPLSVPSRSSTRPDQGRKSAAAANVAARAFACWA